MRFWREHDRTKEDLEAWHAAYVAAASRAEALARCCVIAARPHAESVHREQLRAAVADLCRWAHADGIPAETLLVEIKAALRTSPVLQAASSIEAQALSTRVISLVITSYYDDVTR